MSIGVPVFNGDRYLAECLESLINQTYPHLEIIVCDNGSTDSTPEIASSVARRDDRVRVLYSDTNRGARWNFNRALEEATGPYFRWAAADDLIEPGYVEACVTALEATPDAVLCQTDVVNIDAESEPIGPHHRHPVRAASTDPVVRFRDFLFHARRCYEVFGLMRTDSLRSLPRLGAYGHADGVLLTRIALLGPMLTVAEPLQLMRIHEQQSMSRFGSYRDGLVEYEAWAEWYDPEARGGLASSTWRLLFEFLRTVVAVPGVGLTVRLRCLAILPRWMLTYRKRLAADAKRSARRSPLVRRVAPVAPQ